MTYIIGNLSQTELIIIVLTTLGFLVGFFIARSKYKKDEEMDKVQVKKDIKNWAKLMREANQKISLIYKELNEVYGRVGK